MILNKPAFKPFTVKEIKPEGWLLNQLRIQASGLSGNLDKFWPDIKDSKWIGGQAEGWERVPYWLDGFIPLAWLLDDEDMMERATYYINCIIDGQAEDGWICPDDTGDRSRYDVWAKLLVLKVLVVYYEATEDKRIEDVVRKALKALDEASLIRLPSLIGDIQDGSKVLSLSGGCTRGRRRVGSLIWPQS